MRTITYDVSFTPRDETDAPTVNAVVSYNGTGAPSVKSVLMTAGGGTDDAGLDFASVLSALGAAVGALTLPSGGDVMAAADADPQPDSGPTPATRTAARQSPTKKTAAKKTAAKKTATKTTAKPAGKKSVTTTAANKTAKPVKRVNGAATATAPGPFEVGKGRRYREMPTDFADVYAQTSSTKALVDHYAGQFDGDLPVHTVQGWIRRHKEQQQAKAAAPADN